MSAPTNTTTPAIQDNTDAVKVPAAGWRTFVPVFVLLAIILIGLALRVHRIAGEAVAVDESVSYPHLHLPTLGAYLDAVRTQDPPMSPLYFTLQYYWAHFVGDSVVAVRMLSLLFGVATLPLLYLLGSFLYNRSAGLIAALCAALAIPHIYYSQDIRMYALMLFLSVASMYALVRALRGSPYWWVLHAACNALLLATHLFAVLLIAVQALFLLSVHARRWKVLSAWAAVHAVFFVPYLIHLNALRGAALDHSISLIPIPSLRWLLNTYCVYYTGLEPWGGRLPDGYGPVYAVAVLLLAALAACFIGTRCQETLAGRREAFVLLGIWYLFPPLALYVLSFCMAPCFVERYALSSSFALFLLLGGVFTYLNRPWWTAVVLCVLGIAYALAHGQVDRPLRLDYRKAAMVLQSSAQTGEPIIGWKEVGESLLQPYLATPLEGRFTHVDTLDDLLRELDSQSRPEIPCWVLVYSGPEGDPRSQIEPNLRANGLRFHRTALGGLRPLHIYQVKQATGG